MPNAIIVVVLDIFMGNAHQHHDHHSEVEDRIVVDGIPGAIEEDVEGDNEEVVVEDHNSNELELL